MEPIYHPSSWERTAPHASYPSLHGNLEVDVVIIGGGMTGLTAAHLLKRQGKSVAVLEAHEIGGGTTGGSSAHLTTQYDHEYAVLLRAYGAETAHKVQRALSKGIELIESHAADLQIACDFKRVPGYLYTEDESGVAGLSDEFGAALEAGLEAQMVDTVPLPFATKAGYRVDHQAQFHPLSYLQGLAAAVNGGTGHIFAHSRVTAIKEGDRCTVQTEHGTVTAGAMILATHTPLGLNMVQMQLAPVRSYLMAFTSKDRLDDALFWDTRDPYNYIRSQDTPDGRWIIVGGQDRKTAHGPEEESFQALERYARDHFQVNQVKARWSAQFYDPADHLPYIGPSPMHPHVYLATGYSGDGLTLGSFAGYLLAEQVQGIETAYDELFRPTRLRLQGARDLVNDNLDVMKHMVKDWLPRPSEQTIESLGHGEGRIVQNGAGKLAVYKSDSGEVRCFSAVCPHMKAVVHWNSEHKTFDCPCHGSRFDTHGKPLEGPSLQGLTPHDL